MTNADTSSFPLASPECERSRAGWSAWFVSFLVHLIILVGFSLLTTTVSDALPDLVLLTPPTDEPQLEEALPDEIHFDVEPADVIGSSAVGGLSDSEIAGQVPHPEPPQVALLDPIQSPTGTFDAREVIEAATGPQMDLNHTIKGAAGVAVTGADGAVDRITQEILLSLEDRETLVVWFFDKSGSLQNQRKAVNARFARVYEELGVIESSGNEAFRRHSDKPLLTSVIAFGANVEFLLRQPTDDLQEIQASIAKIKLDESGDEQVFTAIRDAVQRYRKYRTEEDRNLMFIVFTDEAGNDQDSLDSTVDLCRRFAIPVYVVGVPAPFGRRETLVKWVDPDPKFDQTPQLGRVEQGPETLLPERVQLPLIGLREEEAPIDSGFGPFALTRLCFETGGIYFTVHPNRTTQRRVSLGETETYTAYFTAFFDPEVMKRYRPEYVSKQEYLRQAQASPLRSALLRAAEYSALGTLEQPRRRFVVRSESALANELTDAQKDAAKLEQPLRDMLQLLQAGEAERRKEIVPRWQAGFDLAIGRVLANKVRTEGYNIALAKAKRGMKFAEARNNTWRLVSDEVTSGGSRMDQEASLAREYLERVRRDHPATPWAWIAERELEQPLGWQWHEEFTQLEPPSNQVAGNNNNNPNARPRDEKPQMLKPPPQRRPPPRL